MSDEPKQRKYKSILQEINTYVPASSKEDVVEARAQHVMTSAINLLKLIHETYTPEEAEQLEKRFMSSIRGQDTRRFGRSIKKIKESRDANK